MTNKLVPPKRWLFTPVLAENTTLNHENLESCSSRDYHNDFDEKIGVAYYRLLDEEFKNFRFPPDFIDYGHYIAFPQKPDCNAITSALELFEAKYESKQLQLTGDADFCETAAHRAIISGISIANPEMQEYVANLQAAIDDYNEDNAPG